MAVIRLHINNINVLRKKFPILLKRLTEYRSKFDNTILRLETSRRGEDTLGVITDEDTVYLHSTYDPIREADTIISEYCAEIEDGDVHVVFYGIGLGYHIEAFCKLYPRVPFSIFEPVPEVLNCYLNRRDLEDLSVKSLQHLVLGIVNL